jgi:hypothetical protein
MSLITRIYIAYSALALQLASRHELAAETEPAITQDEMELAS